MPDPCKRHGDAVFVGGGDTDRKEPPWYKRIDPTKLPFASGIRPRSIYDLERGFDNNGREVFVEQREEGTGQLKVWFRVDERNGRVTRWLRKHGGVFGEPAGKSSWI